MLSRLRAILSTAFRLVRGWLADVWDFFFPVPMATLDEEPADERDEEGAFPVITPKDQK